MHPFLTPFEEQLKTLFDFPPSPQEKLFAAARHIVLAPGKRLRPLILLTTVAALDGPLDCALKPACALEILHTYSLIHDDLPCMDDDDYRRGLLTLHKKYDEATAVLTGDFLLTYAFEILAESPGLSAEARIQMIQVLAKSAGGQGMIGGQILDLDAEVNPPTLDQLKRIHQRKTADLFAAAFEMGGIISGASPQLQKELCLIGEEVGLAFQIIDDVIDLTDSVQKHGKTVSSDAINGKTTYVSLLGIEGAKQSAHQLLTSAGIRLDSLPHAGSLKELITAGLIPQGFL